MPNLCRSCGWSYIGCTLGMQYRDREFPRDVGCRKCKGYITVDRLAEFKGQTSIFSIIPPPELLAKVKRLREREWLSPREEKALAKLESELDYYKQQEGTHNG